MVDFAKLLAEKRAAKQAADSASTNRAKLVSPQGKRPVYQGNPIHAMRIAQNARAAQQAALSPKGPPKILLTHMQRLDLLYRCGAKEFTRWEWGFITDNIAYLKRVQKDSALGYKQLKVLEGMEKEQFEDPSPYMTKDEIDMHFTARVEPTEEQRRPSSGFDDVDDIAF